MPSCLQRLGYSIRETSVVADIRTTESSTITELRKLCCSTNVGLVVEPRTIRPTARLTHLHKFRAKTSENAELVTLKRMTSYQLSNTHCAFTGRDGSVGIATRYGLEDTGIESRWRREIFRTVQTGTGA